MDSGEYTAAASTTHEVKGLFFVVARKYLLARYGVEAIAAMAEAMGTEHRGVLLEPLHSSWYPEEALQRSLEAFHSRVAGGDDAVFLAALEACALDGVNRFFQILLGLTSPAFVLRKCPVIWRFVRRGPGSVHVEADETRALVTYRDFPYFEDRNYRLMMEATLRGVGGLARPGERLKVRILRWDAASLDAEVLY